MFISLVQTVDKGGHFKHVQRIQVRSFPEAQVVRPQTELVPVEALIEDEETARTVVQVDSNRWLIH